MTTYLSRFLAVISFASGATLASGSTIIWSGLAGNGNWNTGTNWVGDSPPANSDFTDNAQFDGSSSSTTINRTTGTSINSLFFDTAGWTITGSAFNNVRVITSAGAGTNYLDVTVNLLGNRSWTIGANNTLQLNNLYIRSNTLNIRGGGTFILDTAVDGFGSGTFSLDVEDATVRITSSSPFDNVSSSMFILIDDETAVFQYQNSVANAENLIATNRIVDNTGLGLAVTDIGGGFVQVTPVPEPQTYALLFSIGVGLIALYRRKQRS